jgi:hypothetical protein
MPAILSITYTPNYPSNHRICFRTTGSAYCCYNDDSPSVIGVPKTVDIELDDFELCLQDLPAEVGCAGSVVEGYVQPICIDQGSVINRVDFTATFSSTPCSAYNIECQESGIAEIELTEQGLGWLPGEIATITITDNSGYGSGATAEAIMACNDSNICYVESILITDQGEFYYFVNQISIDISLPPSLGGTPATAIVSSVDDCSTFTVPDCDGTANPTTYKLWAGSEYAINICAGGAGPVGATYNITENAIALPGDICFTLGTEGFGPYTCSISPAGTYNGKNYYIMVGPDCVTPYDRFIAPNAWTVWYSTGNGYVDQWVLSEGLNQYLYVQSYLPVSSSPDVPLGNWVLGPESSVIYLLSTDTNCQISCCNCVKYDVINLALVDSFDFYYTDCSDQTIKLLTIAGQETLQVCAIDSSVWVENVDNNDNFEYVVSAIQDC